jgi:hypothetical protein
MTFTSVSREHLQKAFGLAHKLSESASVPNAQRAQFRVIAHLIWKAHGEPGAVPARAGQLALDHFRASVETLTAETLTANERTSDPNPQPASIQPKKESR